jgi:acetyl-CoA carboxylase carboxyl transferase subunit alpha
MIASEAPFDAPLAELRRRIEELEGYPAGSGRGREIEQLRKELAKSTKEVYGKLDRWQTTLVARHSDRPHTLDYVRHLMTDWVEMHGDRAFGDDPAVVAGLARFGDRSVVVLGHEKGRGTKERIRRNFGQPRPEGYRKTLRVMRMAERFNLPILTFVDTPGAYPGIGAEERGQAEAIANNLIEMSRFRVPILVTVTGEGGSGGALALGIGNRVLMLQYSIYSVISPEGCAAILWKDQAKKQEAAEAMKISAGDLLELGIVDEVIPEPAGGAHASPEDACRVVGECIEANLAELEKMDATELIDDRARRFRALGRYLEG